MAQHLIHLICGSTGAGKTTYALDLAERIGAVRFSIDEWMTALFLIDSPQPLNPDPAWWIERVERCYAQMWVMARQVASRGVPSILDFGFSLKSSRERFADLARAAGFPPQLHFIEVPLEERWRRVQKRNAKKGETAQLNFEVTREMFDFVETLWEPPSDDEMAACDGSKVSG